MTPSQIADVIKDKLDEMPWEFKTTDTFKLFDPKIYNVKYHANMALRMIEREGRILFAGRGQNRVGIWRKNMTQPKPSVIEWI